MTKLVRFHAAGAERLGVALGDYYIDAARANHETAHLFSDALTFFDEGRRSHDALRRVVDRVVAATADEGVDRGYLFSAAESRTLVPIPNPRKVICVARNFGKHAAEAGLPVSEIPILFPRFAATLIADGEAIEVPPVSSQVDWEGEVAVIIGTGGRYIDGADAMKHVAGYTIFNDVSIRDYQFRVSQYTGGKNFATSGPIGPTITLRDERIDPHNVQITTIVNGVLKQDASTSEFIFDVPTIIEHISEFIHLEPGDIIPMGTPAGVGFKRTPPEYLKPGDVVEVLATGLGSLRNPVVAGSRPTDAKEDI